MSAWSESLFGLSNSEQQVCSVFLINLLSLSNLLLGNVECIKSLILHCGLKNLMSSGVLSSMTDITQVGNPHKQRGPFLKCNLSMRRMVARGDW